MKCGVRLGLVAAGLRMHVVLTCFATVSRSGKKKNFFGQPYIRALPTTIRGEPEFGQRAAEQMILIQNLPITPFGASSW